MALEYDSEQIRKVARDLRGLSGEIEEGTTGRCRRADEYSQPLKGKAAERFRESQELLAASIRRVSGELDEVGSALERYAAVLEETAATLKEQMA